MEPHEREHTKRKDDDNDPRTLSELSNGEDEVDDERQRGSRPVDDGAAAPLRLAVAEVVFHHACARHRETGEDPDRVERDQAVDPARATSKSPIVKFLCAYNIYKYINSDNKNKQNTLCEKIESKEYPSDLDETFTPYKRYRRELQL